LPLSSLTALKIIKEAQDEEEPPKPFSVFQLKGNSKIKEEVQKFSGSGGTFKFKNESQGSNAEVVKKDLFNFNKPSPFSGTLKEETKEGSIPEKKQP
jgi:hypothetical protein